jgi:hypothetical protein
MPRLPSAVTRLCSQMPPNAARCGWPWDMRGINTRPARMHLPWSGNRTGGSWDQASDGVQGGVDALVGDGLAVIETFGVDAKQDFHAVPRTSGHVGGGHSRIEPQGDGRVPQVVWPRGQWRGDLSGGKAKRASLGPNVADSGRCHGPAGATGRTLGPHLRRPAGEALDAHPGCELDLDRDIEWQLSHPYRAASVSSSVAEDLD